MIQTVEQTHEQKVEMYKKEKKIKLIEMLIECNNQLDAAIKNRTTPNVVGQRELLLAYTTALRENFIKCRVSQINHRDVYWFLQANNCP